MSADDEDDELHLEMHRAADELGKYAARLMIRREQGISPQAAKDFMRDLLVTVTKECFSAGADLIGHVKAFMHADGGTLMGSLVDMEVGVQLTSGLGKKNFNEAEVTLHVIVHGIWDDKVKDASRLGIEKTIRKHSMELEVLQDYFDTEKSIEHHLRK
ncbi:MAG: hypothetical protein QW520_05735 [Methanomassiliicoccales archaeon]